MSKEQAKPATSVEQEARDSYSKELARAKRQIQRLRYDLLIAKMELEESEATVEYLKKEC